MKTFFFLFFIFLIISPAGYAQYPYGIMPGPVIGIAFGDTFFNTPEILKKSGIKKVYAYQTAAEKLKSFK